MSVTVYVHNVSPSLNLKLSGSPGAVDPGQQVTYTATVSNSGNGADGNVAFQDLLPGKATSSRRTRAREAAPAARWFSAISESLNAGASATITIVVTANAPGKLTDHAWVSANPPGNWQHERAVDTYVRNVSSALALRLSGSPGSVNAGQQVTYTATVTNTGNGSDAVAGFQDLLPNNTTLVSVTTSQGTCSGNPTVECNLGALDRGASATITIVVTANQAGRITDRAWVSTSPPGHWEHEHSVDTHVHVAPPAAAPPPPPPPPRTSQPGRPRQRTPDPVFERASVEGPAAGPQLFAPLSTCWTPSRGPVYARDDRGGPRSGPDADGSRPPVQRSRGRRRAGGRGSGRHPGRGRRAATRRRPAHARRRGASPGETARCRGRASERRRGERLGRSHDSARASQGRRRSPPAASGRPPGSVGRSQEDRRCDQGLLAGRISRRTGLVARQA